ncbi:MAG: hypothetical protein ABFD29_00245 [Anaerolineaceae bacterium]
MLNFLPVLFLVIGAILIGVVFQFNQKLGVSWFIAIFSALFCWLSLIVLRFFPQEVIIINHWSPIQGLSGDVFVFELQKSAWIYAFSLASIALAGLLTVSVRIEKISSPAGWAGSLMITALGIISVMSGSPLTLLFGWVAIDVVELLVMLITVHSRQQIRETVIAFAIRIFGAYTFLLAMILSTSNGQSLSYENLVNLPAVIIIVAVILRLGILPLNLPYTNEFSMRLGVGNVIRMSSAASSLFILSRLPENSIPLEWQSGLLTLVAIPVVFGAVMWANAKDELSGRPYWIIPMAGLAISATIQGFSQTSVAWGMGLILSGSMIFLFSDKWKNLYFLPVLGLLSFLGLPFTPLITGWSGLLVMPYNLLDFMYVLSVSILAIGYVKKIISVDKKPEKMERWVTAVYPIGLALIIVSQLIIVLSDRKQMLTLGMWWVSIIVVGIIFGGYLLIRRYQTRQDQFQYFFVIGARFGKAFSDLLQLKWLYAIIDWIYAQIKKLVDAFAFILEGEAGILWTLVLLTLVITLIQSGGGQ